MVYAERDLRTMEVGWLGYVDPWLSYVYLFRVYPILIVSFIVVLAGSGKSVLWYFVSLPLFLQGR